MIQSIGNATGSGNRPAVIERAGIEARAFRSPDRDVDLPDRLELSADALAYQDESSPKPIRDDLVERVRQQIAANDYLTPEKIDAAIDQLYAELVGG